VDEVIYCTVENNPWTAPKKEKQHVWEVIAQTMRNRNHPGAKWKSCSDRIRELLKARRKVAAGERVATGVPLVQDEHGYTRDDYLDQLWEVCFYLR
jgi:hypothetical protein